MRKYDTLKGNLTHWLSDDDSSKQNWQWERLSLSLITR